MGVRAFYVQRADGPGPNNFRVRVDRISDSRFERSVLLGFLDRDERDERTVAREDNEMSYLHQHLFWRVSKLEPGACGLPEVGDELWVHLPEDKIYLVAR